MSSHVSSDRRVTRGFLREAWCGLILSLLGGILYSALTWVTDAATSARLTIAIVHGAAALHALSSRDVSSGRVALAVVWLLAVGLSYAAPIELAAYAVAQAAIFWLLRTLIAGARPVEAMLDFGSIALGLAASAWAVSMTASPTLSLWCFFLVRSLDFAFFEPLSGKSRRLATTSSDKFESAHAAAMAACQRLRGSRFNA